MGLVHDDTFGPGVGRIIFPEGPVVKAAIRSPLRVIMVQVAVVPGNLALRVIVPAVIGIIAPAVRAGISGAGTVVAPERALDVPAFLFIGFSRGCTAAVLPEGVCVKAGVGEGTCTSPLVIIPAAIGV
jgi:hypothetical protein